jgi:pimeloyl-ACP methyl ester carboxylesterase
MKLKYYFLLILFCITNFAFAQKDFEGKWDGKAYIKETTIDFLFTIGKNNKICFLDLPVNRVKDMPATKIEISDDQIVLEFASIKAKFEGEYNPDNNKIEGQWLQGSLNLDLKLSNLDAKDAKAYRPQTPVAPFNYEQEEVTFKNVMEKDVTLAGTLTYPSEETDLPVLIFISGSGPQDRDETIFDHKPFFVMSDYFTRRGYATLRYDDRGINGSTGMFASATSNDFAEDAKAAINYVTGRTDIINPKKVILVGHSEGAMIAQMLAAEREDVAMIVSMAGPGIPIKDLMVLQNDAQGRLAGLDEKRLSLNRIFNAKVFEIAATDIQGGDFNNKIRAECKWYYDKLSAEEKKEIGNFNKFYFSTTFGLGSPWYRNFIAHDPQPYLAKIKIPFLALNGTNDTQVTSTENLEGIELALENGNCKDYNIKELEGLNHLFQMSKTGGLEEYKDIRETINIKAMEEILKFTKKRLKFIR